VQKNLGEIQLNANLNSFSNPFYNTSVLDDITIHENETHNYLFNSAKNNYYVRMRNKKVM
jgi:hypothetical protein